MNTQGFKKWEFTTNGNISSSPSIGNEGTIHVGSLDSILYSLNPNGSLNWIFKTGGPIYSSPVIENDGTIYIGSFDNKLYSISQDGLLKWSFTAEIYSSPIIDNKGNIYLLTYDGILLAIDSSGILKWNYTINSNPFDYQGSSPIIGSDGTLYVGSNSGSFYAFSFITGIEHPFAGKIPKQFVLMKNFPNPFNPITKIRYGLPKPVDVKIEVYNILGERVLTLVDQHKPAGYHLTEFNAGNFASGLYFYTIKADKFYKVRKMLLLR